MVDGWMGSGVEVMLLVLLAWSAEMGCLSSTARANGT